MHGYECLQTIEYWLPLLATAKIAPPKSVSRERVSTEAYQGRNTTSKDRRGINSVAYRLMVLVGSVITYCALGKVGWDVFLEFSLSRELKYKYQSEHKTYVLKSS